MPKYGVVIVGASIGGLTAAETLRAEGFGGSILLVGAEPHLPYSRPPLSKQILLGEWEPGDATIRKLEEIDDLDVELRTSCPATGLEVANHVLHTVTGEVAFDELIIATGSEPHRHPVLPDAHRLRTADDVLRLREDLRTAKSVAVVGSGILGSEIASAARHYGARTLLVGRSGTLSFGGARTLLSNQLVRLHSENDVELDLDTDIERAVGTPRGTEVTFSNGAIRTFDLVVTMIGGAPQTQWLESSSLSLSDGIVCDAAGQAAPGISAIGDVAAWRESPTGRSIRVEHQSNAIEQAIAVVNRLVHGETMSQPTPLFWSEIHKTRIHAYGRFDPHVPLIPGNSPSGVGTVYTHSFDGAVRGIVGWNASPRAFREARSLVQSSAPSFAA